MYVYTYVYVHIYNDVVMCNSDAGDGRSGNGASTTVCKYIHNYVDVHL